MSLTKYAVGEFIVLVDEIEVVVVGNLHQPGEVGEPPGFVVYLFIADSYIQHFAKISGNIWGKVPFTCCFLFFLNFPEKRLDIFNSDGIAGENDAVIAHICHKG